MLMGMYMRVIGEKINLMEKESIFTQMVQFMKENGNMINSMVTDKNNGLMEPITKVNLKMEAKKVKEFYTLQMDQFMRDSSQRTK